VASASANAIARANGTARHPVAPDQLDVARAPVPQAMGGMINLWAGLYKNARPVGEPK